MRIGILTLQLHINYGGILQAAALYRFLTDQGLEAVFLRKEPEHHGPVGRLLRKIVSRIPGQNIGGIRSRESARAKHYPFIKKFLPNITSPYYNSRQLSTAVERHKLDAVIVGSDQVWRLDYHQDTNHLTYFLDFVPCCIKKISYAASFGKENWEYKSKTAEVVSLLQSFDAVSVRESSGVKICNRELKRVQCDLVLDPTLLVDPRLYEEAADLSRKHSAPSLVSYILDQSQAAIAARRAVHEALGSAYVMTLLTAHGDGKKVSIGGWLRAFMDADFVITDSYHGTIFAIIFGKNFIAFGNRRRGLDRFTTLLDKLSLRDRLILDYDCSEINALVKTPIIYDTVRERLNGLRASSKNFLLSSLDQSLVAPAI